MRKAFFIIILLLLLFGCKNDRDNCKQNIQSNYQVLNTQKLNIPIPPNDTYMSFSNQVVGGLLYRTSYFEDLIYIYDVSLKKKVSEIRFPSDGINHISAFQGAAIIPIGLDTIFIANNFSKIYVTFRDSVVFSKVTIDDDILSSKEYRSYGVNRVKPIKIGYKVYMLKVSQYPVGSDNFKKDKTIMNFDLQTQNIEESSVLFPEKYNKGNWAPRQYMVSFTSWGKKLLLNYPIDDDLYVYDINSNSLTDTVRCVRSRFKNHEIQPSNRQFTGIKMHNMYLKQNTFYWSISYIPEQNRFYRIVVHPTDVEEDKITEEKPEIVSPFSVMILDEKFNILAENKFPGKTYDLTDFFVNEKGLWISNNNPENPNFSEDQLSFTLFALGEKKE
ncbi:MAG: hypothetical protein CVT98_00540 [Bacteroidetes bacterium HGW-Bacteroidetes-15]|nr:MAG: hypothetical protein CVT98_00540 [Bacteroidetes bacterium HGW-Bacteroidetes-15]